MNPHLRRIACLLIALFAAPTHANEPAPDTTAQLAQAEAALSHAIELADNREPGAQRAFARAAAAYQRLAESAPPNAPGVHRAAGAAWTYAGETGQAMLAYRRALAADPTDTRARAGRDAIRHAIRAPNTVRLGAEGWLQRARSAAADTARRLPATPAGLVAILLWSAAWITLAFPALRARTPVWLRLTMIALALCALVPTVVVLRPAAHPDDAVVLDEAPAFRGPSDAVYERAFDKPLPPGTELRITERRNGWLAAELLDGRPCWIRAHHAQTVLTPDETTPNTPTK